MFVRIMNAIEEHDDYFMQKRNAAGTLGLSCLQKVVVAFRSRRSSGRRLAALF